jgi:5-methylcytosine-specific restriction endonuclease McrA
MRRPGTRHRRPSPESVTGFIQFIESAVSRQEGAAMLLAIAKHLGVPWSTPSEDRVWSAFSTFAADYMTEGQLDQYRRVMQGRRSEGRPLVDRELVSRVEFRTRESGRGPGRASANLPATADEWVEKRLRTLRRLAKSRHVANQATAAYKELRKGALERARHRCERCGAAAALQLHHLHYDSLGHEGLDDVVILCDSCHSSETHRLEARRRARWRPFRTSRVTRRF